MKITIRNSLLLTSALIGAGTALPAFAQDGNADIIVTARRTEERLQDVPISITVYNQKTLSDRNINSANDLSTYTPSLASNTNYGSENTTFAIRGFTQENGTAPSVGVYFADVVSPRGASNGLPSGDGAAPGSFFDLQNVQILNGPQGTLQGRNTTGGAVLLVPQKPTGKLEGYVEGSVGNYDLRRVQAVVNVPVNDTLRIRLGVDRQTRDGYMNNITNVGPKDFNDIDYTAVRASIVADLTPNLENYTIVSFVNSKTSGPIEKIIAAGGIGPFGGLGPYAQAEMAREPGFYDTSNTVPNSFSKFRQWQIVNTTTWKANDNLTLKNIVSYAQLKQTFNAPLFGTDFLVPAGGAVYHVPFATVTTPPGLPTANESTFTEEFQIQGSTSDTKLTYQGGVYLEVARPLSDVGSQSVFSASCTDVKTFQCSDPIGLAQFFGFAHLGTVNYTVGRTSFHDVGVYGQATYKFTDKIKLTAGVRYTWDNQTNVSTQKVYDLAFPPGVGLDPASAPGTNPRCTNPTPTALANNCTQTFYTHSDKPTWMVDLDYIPVEDVLLYAKYSRGYRAATIAPNVVAPFNYVEPETVDSYEVGLKSGFRGAVSGTFNVAGFYNKLKNQQLQIGFNAFPGTGLGSTAAPVNAGDAEIYGFEVAATLHAFKGLDLSGGYTYLHTKLQNVRNIAALAGPNPVYDLSATFQNGDPEILTPKNKVSVSATYTLPLDESIGKISVGGTFTHRDSVLDNYSDRSNFSPPLPGTPSLASASYLAPLDLVNLNAGWAGVLGSSLDINVFVTNLTKQKYYTYIAGLGGSTFTNLETAQIGEPRMYGLRVKYRFGS